jgi:enolase-phosphatase E1
LKLLYESAEIRVILLDIEGTTTPIDFVIKTLFPFASNHAEDFLRRHFREPEIAALVEDLGIANIADARNGAPILLEGQGGQAAGAAAKYVQWLIARDSKITPLKALEGKLWEEGFNRGELQGAMYPDVAPAFARWKKQYRRIAIFSSGSILAQQQLFANSTAGDLSPFLEGYFDTSTGPKRDEVSYRLIAEALESATKQCLFISDVAAELDAARAAGMRTALSLRPGTARPRIPAHPEIHDFSEIFPDP